MTDAMSVASFRQYRSLIIRKLTDTYAAKITLNSIHR